MDVSVELHCDKCGSANLSLPPADELQARIGCNDCGSDQGTIEALRAELLGRAFDQSAEVLRREAARLDQA